MVGVAGDILETQRSVRVAGYIVGTQRSGRGSRRHPKYKEERQG